MSPDTLARAGGVFAYLAFCHFAADWIFQTHAEAMVKHTNRLVRFAHCAIYTGLMTLAMGFAGLSGAGLAASAAVLFASHFVEDTYLPVYWWARYVRRVPVVRERGVEGFREFVETTLGKILMIAVDQIAHLAVLWLPAVLIIRGDRPC